MFFILKKNQFNFFDYNSYMEVAYNADDLYQLSKLREDKKQKEVKGGKTVRRQMPKHGMY